MSVKLNKWKLILWPFWLIDLAYRRFFVFQSPEFDFADGVVRRAKPPKDTPWHFHEVRAKDLKRHDMIFVEDNAADGIDFVEGVVQSRIPRHVEVITVNGRWIIPARRLVKRAA